MARRRTLGYIQNEWTCPNCETRNKGADKTCTNCGAPQPENVQFELPSEKKFVTDDAAVRAAKAGADVHCGFCGTRNPVTAETCSQCGADLKEGKAREAGPTMQAPPPRSKIVKCDNCGAENDGSNALCSNCGSPLPKIAVPAMAAQAAAGSRPLPLAAPKRINWLWAGGILAVLAICCAIGGYLFFASDSVQATVVDVHWQTSVPVQEIRAVDYSNEPGSPPSDAYNVSCRDESRDICEERTIDRGNGYSEVVEECRTETQQYCSYTVDEWTTIQTYNLDGEDLNPIYESPSIAGDQRLGSRSEDLTVVFSTPNGEQITYSPENISEFQQFQIGTDWTLEINKLGQIRSVSP